LEVLRHRTYGNPRSLPHYLQVNLCRIPSPRTFSALNKIMARHFLCGKQRELCLTSFVRVDGLYDPFEREAFSSISASSFSNGQCTRICAPIKAVTRHARRFL
jgi:hypothetical protein